MFGTFDLVLQNPPFAGNLDISTVNSKLLTITNTRKTELLFVTLMLELMKVGGRGMSIVPDGVLFGSSNAHVNLRKELVENQKLIGVVSMPNGIFMSSAKKGSASKGAGVKTSFLIFEKTNSGGTDDVWFYNMENDGFTLDVKRSPIAGSDIPDVINRFNNLEDEKKRTRKDKSFMVPKSEIVKNGYDLTINKYREIEREVIVHRSTKEIFEDIEKSKKNEEEAIKKLLGLIKTEEE
jgi:type I restriction enzyme M protein